ncbi:hypothetical protein KQ310_05470 [Synechococcus sp. CS-1328]|nr:hypothetical protein [Synechococcus sp. CS-1328]
MPDGATLEELERRSRRQGSGLGAPQLQACWCLQSVWRKGQQTPDRLTSALLQLLGARLEIRSAAPAHDSAAASEVVDPSPLLLTNAVRLGRLELRFSGQGALVGVRPLLRFSFNRLELGCLEANGGFRPLWSRPLPEGGETRRLPFFALIAAESDWLAARGRGGGLALWRR